MAQENRAEDLVVRLLDGRSEQRMLVLEAGNPQRPFAVGRQSNWTVDAAHVAAAHVVLAYNGTDLYVCAVRGERALLDGKPLGRRWTLAAVPGELRFGSARLVFRTRVGDEETVSPIGASEANPTRRVEEHTTIDELRLAEALRLSMEDARMPATAEVDVPIASRRSSRVSTPTSPFRRPAIRPIVVPISHLLRGLDSRSE